MTEQSIKRATEIGTAFDTTKLKAHKHAKSKKVWCIIWLIIIGLLVWQGYEASIKVFSWASDRDFSKQPIIPTVQWPLRIEKKVIISKISPQELDEYVKTEKEKEKEMLVERVYQYVRFLESEIGFNETQDSTHKYCQSINKINEIGYFKGGDKHFCFSTEAKQKEGFMFEYNDRMSKGYTLNEFLCEWVSGTRQPMCKRSLEIGL